MKKIKYAGLALLLSSTLLVSWTDGRQPSISAYETVQNENENIIYITAEGYDKPDHWVGKTQPVTWINIDSEAHTVTDDEGWFDSGPLKPGESFTMEFPRAGVWTYHDNFSKFTGMISVFGRDE